jgi:hypothetical protein
VEKYQALDRTFTILLGETDILDKTMAKKHRENIYKTALLMKLRIATIEDPSFEGPSYDEMDMVEDRFVAITSGVISFPIPVEEYEFDTDLEQLAHFESMTPLKKEIEIMSGASRLSVADGRAASSSASASPSSPDADLDVQQLSMAGSPSPTKGLTRYAESQTRTPLDEIDPGRIYTANAVLNGGRLKPAPAPKKNTSFYTLSLDKVGLKDVSR